MLQKHPRTGCLIAARWPDDFAFVAGAIRHYCGRWGGTEYPVDLAREAVPRTRGSARWWRCSTPRLTHDPSHRCSLFASEALRKVRDRRGSAWTKTRLASSRDSRGSLAA